LFVDVDHRLHEGLRGFLWQVMTDATGEDPVRILSGELLRTSTGVRMRRTVGIAFEGDRRHGDDRTSGQLPLDLSVPGLAFSQCESSAIVADRDADVIRIVE
jgi:hypothetical protein